MLSNPKSTQAEIDAAESVLAKARVALAVDKAPLEDEVNSHKLKAGDHTPASWAVYHKALEHAKRVLANDHAKQLEVNSALKELIDAREDL